MANHKSALKRIRQNAKRREYNRGFRNRARTFIKRAKLTMKTGNVDTATATVRDAIRDLDKAASRGIIHPRNAARRKSRLMKQLAQMQSAK